MRWGDPDWLFPPCPFVHGQPFESVPAPGVPGVAILFRLVDGGAEAQVVAPRGIAWNLRIRVARPAGASLNGETLTALPLGGPAWPLAGPLGDGRARAVEIIARQVRARARRDHAAQVLDAAWNRVSAHLGAGADARLLDIARPFHGSLQWFVYCAIVNDRTGRVAQMASACPGLLSFAASLATRGSIFRGIICGERLRRVLGRAVDSWVMQEDAREAHLGRRVLGPRLEQEPDLLGRQRLLIRRAGPAVSPLRIFRPPPLAFAPEDISADPAANARWYQRMKAPGLAWPTPHLSARAHQGLCLLVSRRAGDEGLQPARPAVWDREMEEVRDYLALTGRVPTRRGNLPELVAASRRWHDEHRQPPPPAVPPELQALIDGLRVAAAERAARPEPAERPAPRPEPVAPPPEPRFPEPPFPDWPPPADNEREAPASLGPSSLVVRAIRTPGELEREGAEMHHCVSSYVNWVMSGQCAIYRVEAAGRRLTLEVVRQRDGWVLGDVKARINHEPGKRAWDALRPWLQAHGLCR